MEVEGPEAARSTSYVHAWHEAPDGAEAEVFGIYRDVLRCENGAWRIAKRRMTQLGARGGFAVPVPHDERKPPPPGWTPPEGLDG